MEQTIPDIVNSDETRSEDVENDEDLSLLNNSDVLLKNESPTVSSDKTDDEKSVLNHDSLLNVSASSPKTTLLGKLKAKQRLQAFLLPKHSPFTSSTIKKTKSLPEPLVKDVKMVRKTKKGPIKKAKSLIEELEEIKKYELSKILAPGPSISPTTIFTDRQANFREKHYHISKTHSKSVDINKKVTDKVKYPKDWKDFKEKQLSIEELKTNYDTGDVKNGSYDFRKQLLFESPSLTLCPLKIKTTNGPDRLISPQRLRYTRKSPSISYSTNNSTLNNTYVPSQEVYKYIPSSHREIIKKLRIDTSEQFSNETPKKLVRKWYSKFPLVNLTEGCELLEQSLGLSILQNYDDEEDEEDHVDEMKSDVITNTSCENVKTYTEEENVSNLDNLSKCDDKLEIEDNTSREEIENDNSKKGKLSKDKNIKSKKDKKEKRSLKKRKRKKEKLEKETKKKKASKKKEQKAKKKDKMETEDKKKEKKEDKPEEKKDKKESKKDDKKEDKRTRKNEIYPDFEQKDKYKNKDNQPSYYERKENKPRRAKSRDNPPISVNCNKDNKGILPPYYEQRRNRNYGRRGGNRNDSYEGRNAYLENERKEESYDIKNRKNRSNEDKRSVSYEREEDRRARSRDNLPITSFATEHELGKDGSSSNKEQERHEDKSKFRKDRRDKSRDNPPSLHSKEHEGNEDKSEARKNHRDKSREPSTSTNKEYEGNENKGGVRKDRRNKSTENPSSALFSKEHEGNEDKSEDRKDWRDKSRDNLPSVLHNKDDEEKERDILHHERGKDRRDNLPSTSFSKDHVEIEDKSETSGSLREHEKDGRDKNRGNLPTVSFNKDYEKSEHKGEATVNSFHEDEKDHRGKSRDKLSSDSFKHEKKEVNSEAMDNLYHKDGKEYRGKNDKSEIGDNAYSVREKDRRDKHTNNPPSSSFNKDHERKQDKNETRDSLHHECERKDRKDKNRSSTYKDDTTYETKNKKDDRSDKSRCNLISSQTEDKKDKTRDKISIATSSNKESERKEDKKRSIKKRFARS